MAGLVYGPPVPKTEKTEAKNKCLPNGFVMDALQDAKPGTFVNLTLDGTIIAKFEYTGGAY